jgi:hypothetical protein
MPYLPIDLDGKRKWPLVATGCSIRVQDVSHGFVELWEMVWRTKVDTVGELELECLFGAPGSRVALVLETFGFLQDMGDGRWRIRGAGEWLKVPISKADAGRLGGQKTAAGGKCFRNLKPFQQKQNPEAPQKQPEAEIEALSPNTQHPTPNKKNPPAGARARDEDYAVGELSDGLKAVFREERGVDYLFGPQDELALVRVVQFGPTEILRRWRTGLRRKRFPTCDTVKALVEHWNSYATDEPQAAANGPPLRQDAAGVRGPPPTHFDTPCSIPGCRRRMDTAEWGRPVCYQHHEEWCARPAAPDRGPTEDEWAAFVKSLGIEEANA